MTQLEIFVRRSVTPVAPAEKTVSGIEVMRVRKEVRAVDWSEESGGGGRVVVFEVESVAIV